VLSGRGRAQKSPVSASAKTYTERSTGYHWLIPDFTAAHKECVDNAYLDARSLSRCRPADFAQAEPAFIGVWIVSGASSRLARTSGTWAACSVLYPFSPLSEISSPHRIRNAQPLPPASLVPAQWRIGNAVTGALA